MTPAQLRAYSAVVRLGSVHAAAEELGMSDAGISADCGIDDVRRADDLSVELSVQPTSRFRDLILSRTVDIALGPPVDGDAGTLVMRPFLRYQILTVTSPANPMLHAGATVAQLREQPWILGPAAGSVDGEIAKLLARLEVPDARQRIFPSDAAALNEVERAGGLTLAPGFAVAEHLRTGRLVAVKGAALQSSGEWCATTLPAGARQSVVDELLNFVTTPRCTQAMIKGSGVGVARFRPKIHVTLWS